MINLETLATEQQNSHSQHIDRVSTEEIGRASCRERVSGIV